MTLKTSEITARDREKHESALLTCVHCGFCLSSCPTYLETGSEADSPRGRIVMMRSLHDGGASPGDPQLRRHLDLCLGCRACEPACPSGVPYGDLIEYARVQLNGARPWAQRKAREALLGSITDPAKLRASVAAANATGGALAGFQRVLQGDPSEKPSDASSAAPPQEFSPLPAIFPAIGPRRARVGLLTGCAMRVFYGDVNRDTAEVLAANGCEVVVNQQQGCCGALHLHNGFDEQGKALARRLIDAFGSIDGLDAIIINSAGCGSTMKEYGAIFADDTRYASRAARLAAKCRDANEFLDDTGWSAPLQSLPMIATYHDACHLAQAQRITVAPRRLLSLVPDLVLAPLAEAEVCCGSAGIYNLTEPEMARRLQRRKIDNIMRTGASAVIAANPGCMAWIAAGLREESIETLHPMTVLRRALA